MKISKHDVVRDDFGHYSHPCIEYHEFPEWLTTPHIEKWESELDFKFSVTLMSDDVDEDSQAYINYFNHNSGDISAWEPTPPSPQAILLSIHDTEDGPVAWWAESKPVTNLTELSKAIYKQNCEVGWWDDPNRCILTTLQLVSTENAEATEGERKNLMDDKLPHRRMGEVELADELVRLLDIAGRFDIPVLVWDVDFNDTLPIAAHHAVMTAMLGRIIDCYYRNQLINCTQLHELASYILKTGEHFGYDIMGALHEKVEFNRTRSDHKRENRAKENGKKF